MYLTERHHIKSLKVRVSLSFLEIVFLGDHSYDVSYEVSAYWSIEQHLNPSVQLRDPFHTTFTP